MPSSQNPHLMPHRYARFLEGAIWLFCALVLVWRSAAVLLQPGPPAGWDSPGHFYLFNKMLSLLREGRLSAYDPMWFGGFPAFVLYPPFAYIVMALPHIFSFGLITPELSFNLTLFAIPFFFLVSLVWTGRVFLGPRAGIVLLPLGLMYLMLGVDYAYAGLGLSGLYLTGMSPGALALPMLLVMLGLLESARRDGSIKLRFWAGFWLALIVLTHTLTALFALWSLMLFSLLGGRSAWRTALPALLVGLLLSAFWWVPFCAHLWVSSGGAIGLKDTAAGDPLLLLFPDLTWKRLTDLVQYRAALRPFKFEFLGHQLWLQINQSLSEFPFLGALLLVGSLTGLTVMLRSGRWFLPFTFLISLLLLPRDLLPQLFESTVYYMRFVQHIFALHLIISGGGLLWIMERLARVSYHHAGVWLRRLTVAVICACVVGGVLFEFDWENPSRYSRFFGKRFTYRVSFEDYAQAREATQVLAFIRQLSPSGRVAIEEAPVLQSSVGSVHYFDSFLPLQSGIATLPGLLSESAFGGDLINAALAVQSRHFTLNRRTLASEEEFAQQSLASMLERLGLYHVEYLVSTSPSYLKALQALEGAEVEMLERFGPFGVFRLRNFRPFVYSPKHQPWLFVEKGGAKFKDMVECWYRHPTMFDYPIIYSPLPLEDLPRAERAQLAGVVVSYPSGYRLRLDEYKAWQGKASGRVVFVGAVPDWPASLAEGQVFFPDPGGAAACRHLTGYLKRRESSVSAESTASSVKVRFRSDKQVSFDSKSGVIVNYSFSPRWRSSRSQQTVFITAPSQIFVFGQGQNMLEYRR